MAKFCTNCGHAIEGSGAFCSYCGAPLADAAAPQPQQAQQPRQAQWQQPQQTQAAQWQPQQTQPPQWQQPTGQWSAPRTQQNQTAPWQQPTAANEWHAAPGSAGSGWTPPRSTSRDPATRVTEAWESYQDSRQPPAAQTARGAASAAGGARIGVPAPGYSDRVNDPELLAALAKQKRVSGRIAGLIVPLPLVGFAIYGLVSDNIAFTRALLYGAIITLVFLIFSQIGKRQSSSKNAYEGVVVDKRTRTRRRSSGGSSSGRDYSVYNELITVVQTSTGEQKKIVETDDKRTLAWDYLQIGERFRYHPEHAFPYELYDKSHAPCLYCVVCQKKNPVTEDRCKKCGAPLLK